MTTTSEILKYKRDMRELKIAEAEYCEWLAREEAEKLSGREKHGAMGVVDALARHAKNLKE